MLVIGFKSMKLIGRGFHGAVNIDCLIVVSFELFNRSSVLWQLCQNPENNQRTSSCKSNINRLIHFFNKYVNSEWMKAIVHIMATTGADWIKEHPHGSYAPVRENSYAQW